MLAVNQVSRKVKMSNWNIVKFQLLTYCYINNIQLSDADLNCLTYLAIEEEGELNSLCDNIYNRGTLKSSQSVRNALAKIEKKGLISKSGKNKKKVTLSSNIKIVTKGNILLDYKFLGIETN